ncbi:MAG: FAD-dependent oxidoreductase, partial [Chloroflexi bacterium]|nr:FAD-dependent oxidoreductase [Chloroflexota bacterium]
MAGTRFVDELTSKGRNSCKVTVFGEEPHGGYNRVLLPGLLAGDQAPSDVVTHPPSWYRERKVDLRMGVRVVRIDRSRKTVHTADGTVTPYDILVLATGSTPYLPEIDGLAYGAGQLKSGIFTFRTLDDCQRIIEFGSKARRVAILGGGFLGLEAASALRARNLEIHIVHAGGHLMDSQLDTTAGSMLADAMERKGIHIHLGQRTNRIEGDSHVKGIGFADGTTLECDLLVVAAGVRPNVELAQNAGLAVRRGVLVNDDLSSQTDAAICAVGECAEHRGVTPGLVGPTWEQARVLAERLGGVSPAATYQGSPHSTHLKVAGVDLAMIGEPRSDDISEEVLTYTDQKRAIYRRLVARGGRLSGAVLFGAGEDSPALSDAVELGSTLRWDGVLTPTTAGASPAGGVVAMSETKVVCNCSGVTEGQILAAVKSGARNVEAVTRATRAGSGCGGCRPQIQSLLADGRQAGPPLKESASPGGKRLAWLLGA